MKDHREVREEREGTRNKMGRVGNGISFPADLGTPI
jgi:hypothetical protein